MTVDYAYEFIQFMSRKNQGNQITPDEFQYSINSAQRSYFGFCMGEIEQYQYGRPVPRVALGMGDKIADDLIPFKTPPTNVAVAAGIAIYPADFYKLATMNLSNEINVERIDDMRLPGRLTSKIDPISNQCPAYNESRSGWRIFPSSITSVEIVYYKLPDDIKWGFTVDVDGRPVYNVGTSVQPLWNDKAMENILGRACRILGFSFSQQNIIQFGEAVKNNGE